MPQDYTVELVVGEPRPWEWKGHQNLGYELKLKEIEGGTVEHSRRPDSPPPAMGEVIYGHIEENSHGKKLKKDQRDNGAQSAPAPPSGQGRTDATGRSIERQVAAKIAGELIGHEGYASMPADVFAEEFRNVTNAVHAAISESDSDIPFS